MSSLYQNYGSGSYLYGGNAAYIEDMYEQYLVDPTSVSETWRSYFDNVQNLPDAKGGTQPDVPHQPVINAFAERAKQGVTQVVLANGANSEMGKKRTAVQQLIAAYRNVGSRWADLDPLKRAEREKIADLDPAFYGFTDADMESVFNISNTYFGIESLSLRELINALRATYCGSIGAEVMYTTSQDEKR